MNRIEKRTRTSVQQREVKVVQEPRIDQDLLSADLVILSEKAWNGSRFCCVEKPGQDVADSKAKYLYIRALDNSTFLLGVTTAKDVLNPDDISSFERAVEFTLDSSRRVVSTKLKQGAGKAKKKSRGEPNLQPHLRKVQEIVDEFKHHFRCPAPVPVALNR